MARALLVALAAVVVALTAPLGTDYPADAGPAIDAFIHGHLAAGFAAEPQMGQLSLWLRVPAGLVARALGGGDLAIYRAGALVCLAAPAALAVWLSGAGALSDRRGALFGPRPVERRAADAGLMLGLLVAIALVANPVVLRALELGHPEEALGAALCTAAVLLAVRRRTLAAAVALGLALATKQWALLAVGPVVLAAPRDHRRLLLVAAGIAAAATLPPLLADPHAFFAALEKPATGLHELRPGNLWSLVLGTSAHVDLGAGDTAPVTFAPGWLRATAHPAVVVLGAALPLLWWRRRHGRRGEDALALLALVLLVRCAIDPWNHEYYHLPFLTALAAWEVVAARRMPLLAVGSSAVLWLVFVQLAGGSGNSTAADAVYVMWAAVACGGLVWFLWRKARAVRRTAAVAVTTS